MVQPHSDDLTTLVNNIKQIAGETHAGCEDDLESLLTWMNPNEPNSNHQMRPPTLRLKNAIKLFINQQYNNRHIMNDRIEVDGEVENELPNLLKQYYVYEVRFHFFGSFRLIKTFKDIQKLEKYYEFPLKHVFLYQANFDEWVMERDNLRHYLLNRNITFKCNIIQRLKDLIMEDDFDLVMDILQWINKTKGNLSSTDILLDLIVAKINKFCEIHMIGVCNKRFLVMETFNKFITKYWSHFSLMLGCPEDDHGLTTVVYNCFERQFISIRTKEIYEIFVVEYPHSKPTILEMRKLLLKSRDFKSLVVEFLSKFEKNILNPSVTTVDALLAYVKTIKGFLTLDLTGRYLNSVTSFVKHHFQDRSDLVIVLLYGILDLQSDELLETTKVKVDAKALKNLAEELRDPEYGIDNDSSSLGSGRDNLENDGSIAFTRNKRKDGNPSLLYEEVLNNFLTWTPEPTDMVSQNGMKGPFVNKSLLDILMEIFESKDFFISEFLKLLKRKLLALKYYKLDRNWSKCMQLLKMKFANRSPSATAAVVSTGPGVDDGKNGDYSNVNNIDVMLWDVKCSNDLCNKMHQVSGLDQRIFPKFISFLYWNRRLENKNSNNIDFQLTSSISIELEKYCNVYSEMKPGRTLQLCKDQGVTELELSFKDGRVVTCDATLEQCSMIQLFDDENNDVSVMLDVDDISFKLKMNPSRVKSILKFWIDKAVLCREGNLYGPLESKQQYERTEEPKARSSGSNMTSYDDEDANLDGEQHLSEIFTNVWPFIQGMLTNLGSLKAGKIHSFLKVTVPKEINYSMITQSQLETYLHTLIEDEKLASTSNGSYKLLK